MGGKGRKAAFDIYERGGVNVLALLSGGHFFDLRVVGDRPRTLLDMRIGRPGSVQVYEVRMRIIDNEFETKTLQEDFLGQ